MTYWQGVTLIAIGCFFIGYLIADAIHGDNRPGLVRCVEILNERE